MYGFVLGPLQMGYFFATHPILKTAMANFHGLGTDIWCFSTLVKWLNIPWVCPPWEKHSAGLFPLVLQSQTDSLNSLSLFMRESGSITLPGTSTPQRCILWGRHSTDWHPWNKHFLTSFVQISAEISVKS